MRRETEHISARRQPHESTGFHATIQLTVVNWIVAAGHGRERLGPDATSKDVHGFAKPGVAVEVG